MAQDRFLIAPLDNGLQTDLVAWQIQDSAYATLNNAYVWRGRLRKRFGSKYMGIPTSAAQAPLFSRLRTSTDYDGVAMVTDGAGTIGVAPVVIVPTAAGQLGQMFSIGDFTYTVISAAAGVQNLLTNDPLCTGATLNNTTGALVILTASGHATAVYYYPANPVMGIYNYKVGAIYNQPTIAFDTQFAYLWGNGWDRIGAGALGGTQWHGSNSQFFWATNYRTTLTSDTILIATNFNAATGAIGANHDPIRYWNGAVWADLTGVTPSPYLTAGNRIYTARIAVQFHRRLLLLNTFESDAGVAQVVQQAQRCRFSIDGSPIAANAWLEPNQVGAGGAGYIDAATKEQIVSAEFIKDRLIVYFERSTWEIAYTGNEIRPFRWQKLNTELGAESTYSRVPFDKVILGIGNTGVHACNGVNVERIDNKIPDKIFQIQNKNEGVARTIGVRDYYTEMVYWTYPSIDAGSTDVFPNRILVYNYNNGTWAFNNDCITFFGYFEQQQDVTWASSAPLTWAQYVATWSSGVLQSQFRQVIGGNQQGFTFIISADITSNARVMQITNLTPAVAPPVAVPVDVTVQSINHTLHYGDYVQVVDPAGTTGLNNLIMMVKRVVDANNFVVESPTGFAAAYIGGGYISRVSRMFIQSKQWNPYKKQGVNWALNRIDFAVKRTSNGEITVDYSTAATQLSMNAEEQLTNTQLGDGVLETRPYGPVLDPIYPLETEQATLWHQIYFGAEGSFVQITMTLSDTQMRTATIVFEDFWLEGLILNTQMTSARIQ
jgi:hypothetical protein